LQARGEERQVLSVARERLYLTLCRRRRIAGRYQDQTESPFLAEIPAKLLSISRSPGLYDSARPRPRAAQEIYSFFGREGRGREADDGEPATPGAGSRGPSLFGPGPRRSPAAPAYAPTFSDEEPPRRPVKRGSRVRHPTLGQGVVLELDGQGEDAKITVFFERAGKRKLVARYASLELL